MPNESIEDILISQDEYIEFVKSNSSIVRCPYINYENVDEGINILNIESKYEDAKSILFIQKHSKSYISEKSIYSECNQMPLDFIKTELPNQKNENAQLVNNHFQFDFKNSNRSNFDEKNSLSTISKNNVTPVPLLNNIETKMYTKQQTSIPN